jgi:cytochrome c2
MGKKTLRLSKTRTALVNLLSAVATITLGSSAALAAGDRAAGQEFFAKHCTPCHSTEAGVNKIGPSLAGVVGRKSGSAPGYNYSAALKAANIHVGRQDARSVAPEPDGRRSRHEDVHHRS